MICQAFATADHRCVKAYLTPPCLTRDCLCHSELSPSLSSFNSQNVRPMLTPISFYLEAETIVTSAAEM